MQKQFSVLSILVIFALILAACGLGNSDGEGVPVVTVDLTQGIATGTTQATQGVPGGTSQVTERPDTGTQSTPTAADTEEPATSTATARATEAPTRTPQAAGATPTTRASQSGAGQGSINHLSTLVGFQVVDRDGTVLGTANDYVMNMCEAHILYIVLDADPSLDVEGDRQILIPYEVVTLEDGVVDEETRTITLNIDAGDLAGAPAITVADIELVEPTWEAGVQAFWSDIIPLTLTTECRLSGSNTPVNPGGQTTPTAGAGAGATAQPTVTGTITATQVMTATAAPNQDQSATATPQQGGNAIVTYRNMLASDLLGAEVQDGNGNHLATVEEAVVIPETGLLRYVVVRLDASQNAGQSFVLVPVGAVNVKVEGQAAAEGVLVLLVETRVLQQAPTFTQIPDAQSEGWDSDAFTYWSEFVPMTLEDLRN